MVKITILGSCRQHSIKDISWIETSNIQEGISYPHYTKEMIEVVNWCNNNNISSEETIYTFRTCMIDKKGLINNEYWKNELNSSDIFILEIASKITYQYKNRYIHHIAKDEPRWNLRIENLVKTRYQTKEEIEEDILLLRKILNKPIIIVTHIYTRIDGERYKLVEWIKDICDKYKIPYIDPIIELCKLLKIDDISKLSTQNIFVPEKSLAHYTELGHLKIKEIYENKIKQVINGA